MHREGVNLHAFHVTATTRRPVAGARGERIRRWLTWISLTAMNVKVGASASGRVEPHRENRRRPAGLRIEFRAASLSQTKARGGFQSVFSDCRSGVPSLRALRVLPANSAWAERSFFPERFCFLWRSLHLGRRYADGERSGPP